ncbi:protein-disulfide reductase DsbD family protein [Ichthyobacterium seriolicida]|uniref:Thiol:disulfide interchange protein DsbD n=1 Tax=Ichthyobacterium seriolicida TaxID=242600 RepID=A0A1J1DWS1_9FLAO|nr:cytochrome c biogenesis protein CcdA [Ichthyobacterium seriolicida]BAV94313.1 thiol:disulfide interchange protein DsbD [Ichthyobacterium seriolicida]
MKGIFSTIILFASFLFSTAQIYDPVKFSISATRISEDQVCLSLRAKIQDGWHMYSQHLDEGGPIPTSIKFLNSDGNYEIIGSTLESKSIYKHSELFSMDVRYFSGEAVFKQKIKLLTNEPFKVIAEVRYMACDDTNCIPPQSEELVFNIDDSLKGSCKLDQVDNNSTNITSDTKADTHKLSWWMIFITGFTGGFLALLTPCVFPMIPLTVSFFTKQSESKVKGIRNAIVYGISIIVIYVLLGYSVTAVFGPNALNALSTNVWFNLLFFLLVVVFAISFLGAFEITIPSSWTNKVDKISDRGGLIGIFFMSFSLALVSFSCTGPIIGTLLVETAIYGGVSGPLIGMFAFSLALALPFTVFALFPNWLKSMPKSGGWLNSVKVILGLLELALALKFLSNADMVLQLHLLEREVFLAIWIVIFSIMGFYLLGKIQFPHDTPLQKVSVMRLFFSIVVFSFVVYMIPGLWGAPLKWISAFPPPQHYSESPIGFSSNSASVGRPSCNGCDNAQMHLGPSGIYVFHDYQKGLDHAIKTNKPILLDFTGHACVNCRKMEAEVWSDKRVNTLLRDKFVVISLYVDEQKELPEDQKYISEHTQKKIETVGAKWSEFQTYKYKTNAQPYYVLLNHKSEKLNSPRAYNTNVDEYLNWMKEGLKNFRLQK